MVRSRGGLTTKIHAVVDAEGRPIALELTAGQAHDSQMALPMLSVMREGTIVLGDKAYDTNALRIAARLTHIYPARGDYHRSGASKFRCYFCQSSVRL